MNKFLTTVIFGLICFLGGVASQYLLPVASVPTKIECREVPVIDFSTDKNETEEKNTQREEEIKAYARKITVKVLSGDNSGSGVLIQRKGNLYQVVTNDHVLLFGRQNNSYKVQTLDRKIYPAKVVKLNFDKHDLGVLEFESTENYEVAPLSFLPIPHIGDKIYASGFPIDRSTKSMDDGFNFTTGKVDMISNLSFRGGYQIGYSNDIEKGMSGGPLLNEKMEVIGLNGRHKYPLWGNPYIFTDGTVASAEEKEKMSQSSWAIPIKTFLKFAPEFAHKNNEHLTQIKY